MGISQLLLLSSHRLILPNWEFLEVVKSKKKIISSHTFILGAWYFYFWPVAVTNARLCCVNKLFQLLLLLFSLSASSESNLQHHSCSYLCIYICMCICTLLCINLFIFSLHSATQYLSLWYNAWILANRHTPSKALRVSLNLLFEIFRDVIASSMPPLFDILSAN